jgi:predicted protein tyrosine phosphatase
MTHLEQGQHLRLSVDDVESQDEGSVPPGETHVRRLIEFVAEWDRNAPLWIHCWAGVSRSTASAFITACFHNPDASEEQIAKAIRAASPTAKPNLRIVGFADKIMNRDGRMQKAVLSMGPNVFTEEATPFSIPSTFDDARGKWV